MRVLSCGFFGLCLVGMGDVRRFLNKTSESQWGLDWVQLQWEESHGQGWMDKTAMGESTGCDAFWTGTRLHSSAHWGFAHRCSPYLLNECVYGYSQNRELSIVWTRESSMEEGGIGYTSGLPLLRLPFLMLHNSVWVHFLIEITCLEMGGGVS